MPVERRTIVFPHPRLAGLEHPAFEVRGAADGPHVALLGGVHGCEYSSIAAVTRFVNELDPDELAGSLTAVPVVSMHSFAQRSQFVVPDDGKNLNRCFPGSYDGSYSDVLARSVFDELIAPADALIDLHGGDLVEALVPFTVYDASPVEERSRALAVAFGLPYVVRQDAQPPELGGMTCSAASAAGIPAVIAEAGGIGQLEEAAVAMLVAGIRNALRSLGMLPGPVAPRAGQREAGRSVRLGCREAGWWEPSVRAGEEVTAGTLLGRVRNLWGDLLEELHAPADGVVLFLTTSAAVAGGGFLVALASELEPAVA